MIELQEKADQLITTRLIGINEVGMCHEQQVKMYQEFIFISNNTSFIYCLIFFRRSPSQVFYKIVH